MSSILPSTQKSIDPNNATPLASKKSLSSENEQIQEVSLNSMAKFQLSASEKDLSNHEINDLENFNNEDMMGIASEIDFLKQLSFDFSEGLEEKESGAMIHEEGLQNENVGISSEAVAVYKEALSQVDRTEFSEMLKNIDQTIEQARLITFVDGKATLSTAKGTDSQDFMQAANENRVAIRFKGHLVVDPHLIDSGKLRVIDGKVDLVDEHGKQEECKVATFHPEDMAALTIIFKHFVTAKTDLQYVAPEKEKKDDRKSINDNLVTSKLVPPNFKEKIANANEQATTAPETHSVKDKEKVNTEKANKEKWAKEADERADERTHRAERKEIRNSEIKTHRKIKE